MISHQTLTQSALSLHQHIINEHWNGQVVAGPDPGVRFNARIWRFLKSYTRIFPWSDNMIYAQAQKYWILNNWLMIDLNLGDQQQCREMALASSEYLFAAQQPEGYWEYPNREWQGRIATVEGNYAAIGLLETFRQTGEKKYLTAAQKWYQFAVEQIGFQDKNGLLAINYFHNLGNPMVPNNSASALRVFAMLTDLTGDQQYLEKCDNMVNWLNEVQLKTGELPYSLAGPGDSQQKDRIHFLCYQYNAFQFLNLAEYFDLTQDKKMIPVLEKLAIFISRGINKQGNLSYDCHQEYPEVTYYHTAAGAALFLATELGLGDYRNLSDLAYRFPRKVCPRCRQR